MQARRLKVGLLGCGTVGRGLVELVARNQALIRQRAGVELNISRILVRDTAKQRRGVPATLLTTQPEKVIDNGCDVVVELVGGIEPARTLIQRSLARGKHVVTANKALLAIDGFSLMKAAELQSVRLGFEASVCGGIPIVRALRQGLVGNRVESLSGILNGTCNYILTRMGEDRIEFEAALQQAQVNGFAEADPALDVDGLDAAQKLKILAELAFNVRIGSDAVRVQGIRDITRDDLEHAGQLGFVVKHVASATTKNGGLVLSAEPVLLPRSHALAAVNNENNAVLVRGDAVGEVMFSGKGAGSMPSASAVLSDLVDIACHQGGFAASPGTCAATTRNSENARYYVRFPVSETSAIGSISDILGRNGIRVSRAAAIWARNGEGQHQVRLLTEDCSRKRLDVAREEISRLQFAGPTSLALRIAD